MAQKDAKQIESVEHVPSGEHGGGFPPFQKDTFASQLLWFALVFVTLYLLMSRFALPRVGAILEHRRQRIEGDLAAAQRLKDEFGRRHRRLREGAGGCPRPRPSARQRDPPTRGSGGGNKPQGARCDAQCPHRRGREGHRRQACGGDANVQDIATEAGRAIIERLIGIAPADQQVAAAVAETLKR